MKTITFDGLFQFCLKKKTKKPSPRCLLEEKRLLWDTEGIEMKLCMFLFQADLNRNYMILTLTLADNLVYLYDIIQSIRSYCAVSC